MQALIANALAIGQAQGASGADCRWCSRNGSGPRRLLRETRLTGPRSPQRTCQTAGPEKDLTFCVDGACQTIGAASERIVMKSMSGMDLSQPKLPPQNVEAEQSVFGAVLLDNQAMAKAMELMVEENFYRTSHRKIYRAMLELSETEKSSIRLR